MYTSNVHTSNVQIQTCVYTYAPVAFDRPVRLGRAQSHWDQGSLCHMDISNVIWIYQKRPTIRTKETYYYYRKGGVSLGSRIPV